MASTSQITPRTNSKHTFIIPKICQAALIAMESEYLVKVKKKMKELPFSEHFLLSRKLIDDVMKLLNTGDGPQTHDEGSADETMFQLITLKKPRILSVMNKPRLFVKGPEGNYHMITPVEDIFDTVWKAHKNNGHPDSSDLFKILKETNPFPIPKFTVDYINEVCLICSDITKPYSHCTLDLIPMTLTTDYAFSHIMIYEDLYTGYKHIRPLCVDTAATEICLLLLRIFMDFGPPRKVFISNPIFNVPIDQVKQIAALPTLDTIAVEIEPNEDKINGLIQRFKKWMTVNDCKHWSLGCYIIQLELNNEVNDTDEKTPFSKVFRSLKENAVEVGEIEQTVAEDTAKTLIFTGDNKSVTVYSDEDLTTDEIFVEEEQDPLAI